jgi:glycosyltransferase involved in cell wall biosynthesis
MNFDFKVFFTVHGFISATYSSKLSISFMDFIEKTTSSLVDHFIFVSENDSKVALNKGWKMNNYTIIYNGIEEVRQKYNLILSKLVDENKNKMIFGTVARLSKQKNPLKLLNLINNNREEFNDKFFIWIGSGNLETKCREFVKENDLKRYIYFTGKIIDANKHVNYFDIFYLLSSWECLPISIIEALQQGLPILATDVGGVSEMVTEMNGILLPKDYSEKDFLESIDVLSCEKIKDMSNNSVRIYKENFTLKKMIKKYNNIFN